MCFFNNSTFNTEFVLFRLNFDFFWLLMLVRNRNSFVRNID